jgi:membrane protein
MGQRCIANPASSGAPEGEVSDLYLLVICTSKRRRMMNLSALWQLLKETYTQWSTAKPFQLAAALAYYTLFSLAPLLLIAIAVAGLVFGRAATEQQILTTLQGLMGPQGAQAIQGLLQSASTPTAGLLATVIGIVTLLIGAGGVVGQLQEALNTIWQVEAKPGGGLWSLLRTRFVSFAMVLGVGFLLLVSLLISAALAATIQVMGHVLPGGEALWHGVEFVVSLGLITLLFALIYKVLPDVEITWRDVWIGAALTAVLFTVGKFLLGLYLGRKGVTSPYGAAGSLVLVLLWVYYSGLIVFFGAAFTKVYATTYGAGVRPAAQAVMRKGQQGPPPQEGTRTGHAQGARHQQSETSNGVVSAAADPGPQ